MEYGPVIYGVFHKSHRHLIRTQDTRRRTHESSVFYPGFGDVFFNFFGAEFLYRDVVFRSARFDEREKQLLPSLGIKHALPAHLYGYVEFLAYSGIHRVTARVIFYFYTARLKVDSGVYHSVVSSRLTGRYIVFLLENGDGERVFCQFPCDGGSNYSAAYD